MELVGLYIVLYLLFATSSALRANTHDTLSLVPTPVQLTMSTQV
jgi:hypothetical protein